MGAAAIGGGEWLLGPAVTAKYGGAVMWLATLSILFQVVYNIEVSRYALYTGEPIFTGKFRCVPGPRFWLGAYLLLDFGAVFPALAAHAATPLAAVLLGGELPRPDEVESHWWLMRILAYVVFIGALIPLVVGGKVYRSLKVVMTMKLILVMGFLVFVAIFFSTAATWKEIFVGFFRFGTLPVGGSETTNIFAALARGDGLPDIDFTTIALLAAFASIAGNGGLGNAIMSNYTRDQGWGMGKRVGAIPSVIGGRKLWLSHVGMVFEPNAESMPRWQGWLRHVRRDQLAIWMPACFLGMALPAMLSIQFLQRGTEANNWAVAGMTADGVATHVAEAWGAGLGVIFWYLTMLCGFLVLAPSMAVAADNIIRRWVDIFWTSSPKLRKWDPHQIRWLYFGVVAGYASLGLVGLSVAPPLTLLTIAANLGNFALGISCFHALAVNVFLLPKELRPGWIIRSAMLCAGVFFIGLASISALRALGWVG